MGDMTTRRTMILGGGAMLALTACGTATKATAAAAVATAELDLRDAVCGMFADIAPLYPKLRGWAIERKAEFPPEQWEALVEFDGRITEIGAILEEACRTKEVDEKWANAAGIVIRVARIAIKAGVGAGLL